MHALTVTAVSDTDGATQLLVPPRAAGTRSVQGGEVGWPHAARGFLLNSEGGDGPRARGPRHGGAFPATARGIFQVFSFVTPFD